MLRRPSCAVLVLIIALAGCGGSDEGQVRDALNGYVDAILAGDWKQACSKLTVDGKEEAARNNDTSSCEHGMEKLAGQVGAEGMQMLRDMEITAVKIDGDDADVIIKPEELFGDSQELHKVDGKWLLGDA